MYNLPIKVNPITYEPKIKVGNKWISLHNVVYSDAEFNNIAEWYGEETRIALKDAQTKHRQQLRYDRVMSALKL